MTLIYKIKSYLIKNKPLELKHVVEETHAHCNMKPYNVNILIDALVGHLSAAVAHR